jgi:hypothetical protein
MFAPVQVMQQRCEFSFASYQVSGRYRWLNAIDTATLGYMMSVHRILLATALFCANLRLSVLLHVQSDEHAMRWCAPGIAGQWRVLM